MNLFYLISRMRTTGVIRVVIAIGSLSIPYAAFTATPLPSTTTNADTTSTNSTAATSVTNTATTASATPVPPAILPIDIDTTLQQAVTNSFAGDVDRVDYRNGIVLHSYVDMRIPGNGGFDLSIIRSYSTSHRINEYSANKTGNGLGWRIDFGKIMVPRWVDEQHNRVDPNPCSDEVARDRDSAFNPIVTLPGQGYQTLTYTSGKPSYTMQTSDNVRAYCKNGQSNEVVINVLTPNGLVYEMSQHTSSNMSQNFVLCCSRPNHNIWHTTKITDRNGNYINIIYKQAESPEIARVVANDGRVVEFEYVNSGTDSARVKSIRSGNLITQYEYDDFNLQLKKVTLADNTTYQYEYYPPQPHAQLTPAMGSSFLMKSVTLPTGGIIEYEYADLLNPQRSTAYVVATLVKRTKKQAGKADVVSEYFYNGPDENGKAFDWAKAPFDSTAEITGSQVNTYFFHRVHWGWLNGDYWKLGLLAKKYVDNHSSPIWNGGVRTELYNWNVTKASDQDSNGDSFFPSIFLWGVRIIEDGAEYTRTVAKIDSYNNPEVIEETGFDASTNTTTTKTITNTYLLDVDLPNNKYDIRKLKTSTISDGSTLTNDYDSSGNLKSSTKNGITTKYFYDAANNNVLSSIVSADGLSHYYGNYKRGVAQTESHPDGITLSRTVDDAGNVLTELDAEQHTTTFTYDGLNRVQTVQQPLGSLRKIDYSANQKTVSYGDSSETTTYDGFGRQININSNGVVSTMEYDDLGRKSFASNPNSDKGTHFFYDLINRPIRTENSDGSVSTISYGKGTVTTTNERQLGSYRYDYRAYGDPDKKFLMTINAPEAAATITIGRKANDLIETVTQDGVKRSYTYYPSNYLESVTHPELGKTVFERDAMGNMTSKKVADGKPTIYTYNGQNLLKTITYPDDTPAVSYDYSKTGKLKSVTTTDNVRAFAYDDNDNLKMESLTIDGLNFTTGYDYDATNALKSMTLPRSKKVIEYAPDAFGRPTQVSGLINNVTYWPSGQVNQITYANGLTSSYGQNDRLLPDSFVTQKDNTAFIQSTYGYDGVGNLKSVVDPIDPSFNRALDYDKIDRITTANGSWGTGTISYDGRGNITSQYLGNYGLNYVYEATTNRLNSVSGYRAATFGYDRNGNINQGFDQYRYNEAAQLTCVNCDLAGKKIGYRYDGQNQRVAVTKAGATTYEIYGAGGKLLLEFTPSQNNKMVEHIYLNAKRIAQRVLNQ